MRNLSNHIHTFVHPGRSEVAKEYRLGELTIGNKPKCAKAVLKNGVITARSFSQLDQTTTLTVQKPDKGEVDVTLSNPIPGTGNLAATIKIKEKFGGTTLLQPSYITITPSQNSRGSTVSREIAKSLRELHQQAA